MKNISEEFSYNDFEDMLRKAAPENSDIVTPYLTDELFNSIKALRSIICRNARIFNYIKDTKLETYQSFSKIYKKIDDLSQYNCCFNEYSDFMKKLKKFHNILPDTKYFIDADDGEKKSISATSSETFIKDISVQSAYYKADNPETEANTEKGITIYKIKTYSPVYAYFIIKNSNYICEKKLTFRKHNSFAFCEEEIHHLIDNSSDSSEHKIHEKILVSYLSERATGTKYKFFLYKYVRMFADELKKSRIPHELINQYINDYYLWFVTFRNICLFADEEFFKELHAIISQLIDSRIRLAKNSARNPGKMVREVHIEISNEILNMLSDCQDDVILSGATSDISVLSDFIYKEIDIQFIKPNDRTKSHLEIWDTVQHFVNTHINEYYNNYTMELYPRNARDNCKRNYSRFMLHKMGMDTCPYYAYLKDHPTQL